MISLKRTAMAMIVFYMALELFVPNQAHAFGKKVVEQKTTTPNTQHPTPNTQHPTPNTQHPTPQLQQL